MNRPILLNINQKESSENGLPDEFNSFFDSLGMFVNDLSKVCKVIKVEERKNKKLLDQNHDRIGKIISCHLVIEHFINRELELLHNIDYNKRRESKLTFYNKVYLLPKKGKVYSRLIKGIKELNKIRNSYAHNLNYDLKHEAIKEICFWAHKIPNANSQILTPTESVEKFTQLCIFIFSMREEKALNKFHVLAKKYPNIPIFDLLTK